MALFEEDELEVTLKDAIPVIHAPEYESHVVDTRYTPRKNIITSISGYPWSVDYYSQVVARDDAVDANAHGRSPIHQQYRRIRHFELKVSSPLSVSQDSQTKELGATGTANVYAVLVPNAGDLFVADIGDGRAGLFSVASSERLSHFKDPVHTIEYQLLDYVTPAQVMDLEAKTVKTLHFRREYLDYGQNPLIEDEVIHWVRKLEVSYEDLVNQYFNQFWSNEYRTLLVPGQSKPTYDPFLTRNVLRFFSIIGSPHYQYIRALNSEDDVVLNSDSIMELMFKREYDLLRTCVRKTGLTLSKYFSNDPLYHGIRHSGIVHVVYPSEDVVHVDQQLKHVNKPIVQSFLESKEFRYNELESDVTKPEIDLTDLIKPVTVDEFYIFSEAFYRQSSEGQSLLELQVSDYLKGKSPNSELLVTLLESHHQWGVLEKFYYTPMLLLLIFANLRTI